MDDQELIGAIHVTRTANFTGYHFELQGRFVGRLEKALAGGTKAEVPGGNCNFSGEITTVTLAPGEDVVTQTYTTWNDEHTNATFAQGTIIGSDGVIWAHQAVWPLNTQGNAKGCIHLDESVRDEQIVYGGGGTTRPHLLKHHNHQQGSAP